MGDEQIEKLLAMLKSDLSILHSHQNEYLKTLIHIATQNVKEEGITLEDNYGDNGLVVMQAAYLFRMRSKEENKMPRMLRYALNKRILKEAQNE